ncbi:hydroxyphenylacetyl-CoA thioesterase PaaI [Mesorhizobium sp. ORM8.1]
MTVDRNDPLAVAKASGAAMWKNDRASCHLGMTLEDVAPGKATLSLTVSEVMTNGHGICHGGYIFTLADSAFAYACNSYNYHAVAQHCSVTFLRPAFAGDRLRAVARKISAMGRSGIYDIQITNQNGEPVAEFRGHSRTIKGTHLPMPA